MESNSKMKAVVTVAGSDSSGGAGIQADLKTMFANGVYGMSIITALTAQNTVGVSDIMEVTPDFLGKQFDMVCTDIRPDAVKIGMMPSVALINKTIEKLKQYELKKIVIDPVMVSTSGVNLLKDDADSILNTDFFTYAELLTPNVVEAECITKMKINNSSDMEKASQIIYERYGCSVLLKGGHSVEDANDLLYSNGKSTWFYGKRIENDNTHGTGCTLSSAIASNLAKGMELEVAVQKAKEYISLILSAKLDLGRGSGPMDHAYGIKGNFL